MAGVGSRLRSGAMRRGPEPMIADAAALREAAVAIEMDDPASLEPLIDRMAQKRFVLLGEATHGTQEFYDLRGMLSLRLIREHRFAGIVAEADWPDAERVNRYLRASDGDASAREALGSFERFPLWMWRNTVVLDLVESLRSHNDSLRPGRPKAGFWGMDLYSLYGSIAAVLEFLDKTDPAAAAEARERYSCFEPFGADAQAYGAATAGARFEQRFDCEDEAVEQLLDLHRRRAGGGGGESEDFFHAAQNARLVANAEQYYRAMYRGGTNTWNLRDTHMADTLDALSDHLSRARGQEARLIVWAHNSHLGDARFTEMGGARGEVNVGQLLRERHGEDVFNLGFTTHTGTVAAADNWGESPRRMAVLPSRPDSIEHLCHLASQRDDGGGEGEVDLPAFALLPEADEAARVLAMERLERAIGVIYRPATERWSHYFKCRPGQQFDALLHVEQTRALHPLDPFEGFKAEHAEAPETFPSGL